jgi:hypothetical protein
MEKIISNRRLVSRNEAAGHHIRKMLPPPVLDDSLGPQKSTKWWKKEDTHLFVLSFVSFFVVFYTFIA